MGEESAPSPTAHEGPAPLGSRSIMKARWVWTRRMPLSEARRPPSARKRLRPSNTNRSRCWVRSAGEAPRGSFGDMPGAALACRHSRPIPASRPFPFRLNTWFSTSRVHTNSPLWLTPWRPPTLLLIASYSGRTSVAHPRYHHWSDLLVGGPGLLAIVCSRSVAQSPRFQTLELVTRQG